jgi:dCMP deaminase
MEGATLYLVGVNKDDGTYVEDANSCSMCKRIIINAGILKVIVRNTKSEYTTYLVSDWVDNDESLEGNEGY